MSASDLRQVLPLIRSASRDVFHQRLGSQVSPFCSFYNYLQLPTLAESDLFITLTLYQEYSQLQAQINPRRVSSRKKRSIQVFTLP